MQTGNPRRGASQSKEPCTASITQIKKCCSVRGVLERSALQHLLLTPTLHRGERSTSQARPQTSSRDNSQWHLLPTDSNTPQKAQAPLP